MGNGSREQTKMTAGLDLGDKYSYLCLLDTESGEVIRRRPAAHHSRGSQAPFRLRGAA